MRRLPFLSTAVIISVLLLIGCSGNKNLIREKNMRITGLEERVDSLRGVVGDVREEKRSIKTELERKLSEAEQDLQVCMKMKKDLLKIEIPDAVRFEFGNARLTDNGRNVLDTVWEVLQNHPDRRILIEGYTDDVPIVESFRHIWPSNWELSTARACRVLHYMLNNYDVDPERLTVSGYGKYHPVADNDTPEGRAKNRRVVISVRDRYKEE